MERTLSLSIFFARRDDFMLLNSWKLIAGSLRAAHCITSR
jgi:hypothetical protein